MDLELKQKSSQNFFKQQDSNLARLSLPKKSDSKDRSVGKKMWNPWGTLRSHLDGVRGIQFSATSSYFATVSEDCMVKIWDSKKIIHQKDIQHLEPYHSVRGHRGPIFTITGNRQNPENINKNGIEVMYTAGTDKQIKAWHFQENQKHQQQEKTQQITEPCISTWDAHDDVIWELNHHPYLNLLISSSSDNSIKLWSTNQNQEEFGKQLTCFKYAPQIYKQQKNCDSKIIGKNNMGINIMNNRQNQLLDVPTSANWIFNNNHPQIISGYVNSSNLVIFDIEKSSISNILTYEQSQYTESSQPNKIITHPKLNCVISAHEDRQIRFFDINSNQMIKNLIGHTDAVTSLSIHKDLNYISSVGHDGSLRTWDIRKYQCLCELPIHKLKYDESIHTVVQDPNLPYLATGGADGLIKMFKISE